MECQAVDSGVCLQNDCLEQHHGNSVCLSFFVAGVPYAEAAGNRPGFHFYEAILEAGGSHYDGKLADGCAEQCQ